MAAAWHAVHAGPMVVARAPGTINDFRGKTIAVTFVYTRCPLPDFCPRMDRHFKAAQAALQSDPALAERASRLVSGRLISTALSMAPSYSAMPTKKRWSCRRSRSMAIREPD